MEILSVEAVARNGKYQIFPLEISGLDVVVLDILGKIPPKKSKLLVVLLNTARRKEGRKEGRKKEKRKSRISRALLLIKCESSREIFTKVIS
jgi:hypothetical protein